MADVSEIDREIARTIVKRCGLRDGLFKGPRTLNAVETIAAALADQREKDAKIVESYSQWIYNGSISASRIAATIRSGKGEK